MIRVSWCRAGALALVFAATSCTVVSVRSSSNPAGVRADGIVDGHAVVGWRDEKQALRMDLFDGTSSGAVFELVLWKLARLELGLAGFGVGVGPFDVALGALWYDPHMPIGDSRRASKQLNAPQQATPASAPGPCDHPGCAESASSGAASAALPSGCTMDVSPLERALRSQ